MGKERGGLWQGCRLGRHVELMTAASGLSL